MMQGIAHTNTQDWKRDTSERSSTQEGGSGSAMMPPMSIYREEDGRPQGQIDCAKTRVRNSDKGQKATVTKSLHANT
jgi:hypothetical protein